MSTRIAFVRNVWQDMIKRGGIEKALFPNLEIHSTRPNYVRAKLEILPQHTNRLGIVHGGVLSTLVDIGGSLAMASQGKFMTGVTTDLATTFLSSGGKPGEILAVDCHLQKLGRTMAFTFVEIGKLDNGEFKLVARGNHTKYIANALKSEHNVDPNWIE